MRHSPLCASAFAAMLLASAAPALAATTTPSPTPSTIAALPSTTATVGGRAPVIGPGSRVAATGTTLPPSPVPVRLTAMLTANQPIALSSRPGDDTLFLADKSGRVRAVRGGSLDSTVVLDISRKVTSENERGLLGIAFKPDDPTRMFVDYTDLKGSVTVSEFPFDGTRADPSRERVLLSIPKPFNEHNAGSIVFDRSGMLLIPIGDGGGSGDPNNNAQRTGVLLGKVLRIDVNPTSDAKPYAIPADNPFVPRTGAAALGAKKATVGARGEVWAYGLRNPWRISVDRATGDVWVPDVGQNLYEEINVVPAGKAGLNFGWKLREGKQAYLKGSRPIGAVDPVYDYPHKDGRCAVAGGFVYRGTKIPGIQGWYVFGDVCTGQINALRPDGNKWTPLSLGGRVSYLTAFGEDNAGELYALSLEGAVSRIDPA